MKFTGDAVKGLVQGVYELSKAGAQIAAINITQFAESFPGMKAVADSFRGMVADAQNFKFDKRKILEFGLATGEVLLVATKSVSIGFVQIGESLYDAIYVPIRDILKDIKSAIDDVDGLWKAVKGGPKLGFPMHPNPEIHRQQAMERIDKMFLSPEAIKSDINDYKRLAQIQRDAEAAHFKAPTPENEHAIVAALGQKLAYLDKFHGMPAEAEASFLRGVYPGTKDMSARRSSAVATASLIRPSKALADFFGDAEKRWKESSERMRAEWESQVAIEAQAKALAEQQKAADAAMEVAQKNAKAAAFVRDSFIQLNHGIGAGAHDFARGIAEHEAELRRMQADRMFDRTGLAAGALTGMGAMGPYLSRNAGKVTVPRRSEPAAFGVRQRTQRRVRPAYGADEAKAAVG